MKKIFTILLALISSSGFAQLYFASRVNYALQGASSFVNLSSGDFNNDGIPDIVVGNSSLGTISLFIGTGTGTFNAPVNFPAGSWPAGPAALDANNDGNMDIAVADYSGNVMSILLGNGAGSFSPRQTFPIGAGPQGALPGDYNEDGKMDVAVANYNSNTFSVLLGNGNGTLQPAVNFATGGNPEIDTRDLNNDGHLDMVILNTGGGNIGVRYGTGTGAFGAVQTYATGSNPRGLAIGDFNGDTFPDLAVGNASSNTISILTSTGVSSFNPAVNFSSGGPTNIFTADYNNDGKLDLAVSNSGNNTVSIYSGSGTGSFSLYQFTTVGSNPSYMRLLLLDLNNDGLLDIVTSNDGTNVFGVLLGNVPTGGAGTALKFNGSNQEAQLGTWFNYQDFTISMWLKPGATQLANANIIDNNHTSSRSWIFEQNGSNTNQYFFDHNGPSSNLITLTAGVWQHVALVSVGGKFYIYLNGQLTSYRDDGPITYDGTQTLRLANWAAGGRNWNGEMDEVRIFSAALTAAQIRSGMCSEIPVTTPNLQAYYRMNEGSGSSIFDGTSNARTGTLINGPTWQVSGADVPTPTITSFAPSSGAEGTVVTINGTNFNSILSANEVSFNGVKALVTSATANTLTAIVPRGGSSGPITVTEICTTATSSSTFNFVINNIIAFEYFLDIDPGFGLGTAVTVTPGITISNFNLPPDISALPQGFHTMYVRSKDQKGSWSHTTSRSFFIFKVSITNLVSFEHFIDTDPGFNNGTITAITPVPSVSNQDLFVDVTGYSVGTHKLYVRAKNSNGKINEVFISTFSIQSLPPTITSFSPSSGPIGTTVTITGTNFSVTPANNIVYFGATRATVTAATTTQLTVTVPIGATYQPITVNVGGLIAYSASPFIVMFSGGGTIDACSFAIKVDFTTGSSPVSVSIGDLDVDGKADLAVANFNSNTLSVFRNTSSGAGSISYAAKIDFSSGSNPESVSIGDLDGDGRADLAATNRISSSVSVLRNTSSGAGSISNAAKVDFTTGTVPPSVSIGDLDGDGKAEMAVANYGSNTVSVFRNTSSGAGSISNAAKIDFATGAGPESVSISDLDGDGKFDLAVANYNSNTVSIFRNTSSGAGSISYAAKVDFPTGLEPGSVAIGDLDGDGKADLAVANYSSSTVSVFRNTSSGAGIISYATKVDFATGVDPKSVSIGDLDGDGKVDLAVVNENSASISLLRNTSSIGIISYAPKVDFTTGTFPQSVSIGDLDGDGKVDLAVANIGSATVSVFRNTIGSVSPPTIASFTPSSGAISAPVTITGTNFDTTPANNIVSFNSTAAVVTASTITSITTTVPVGATTGLISVMVGCNTAISSAVFTVGSTATITINTQPTDFIACEGQTATFTTAATGTTNITYQWQFSPDGIVPFGDITNGGGYAMATTSTLTVNTTGTFGAGRYRCRINGDLAAQVFTFDEGLFINSLPTAPGTTGNSGCSSSSITLSASGGVNGQYRWYTVATGGTAIVGAVNSTYLTPTLTVTTTYFVAINNGTCESLRTSITATVIALPLPPGVTPGSSCAPSSTVLLSASGASNGQYRWYVAPTGGSPIAGETNSTYTTPIISSSTTYYVSINNGTCEGQRVSVLAEIRSCTPVITATTINTQVGGQVSLNITPLVATFNNPIDISSIKVIQQPLSTAMASVSAGVLLVNYAGVTFAGTDRLTIEACDVAARCAQQVITIEVAGEIVVFNALSPNGDGKNEILYIQYIDLLPETKNNKVTIFDRWGSIVFEVDNYDNANRVFRGINSSGGELPSGTYYYKLAFSSQTKTGFISLRR